MNIHPNTEQAYRLFHDGTLAFARAEQQGIRVDMAYAERKKQELDDEIIRLENTFKQTKLYRHWQHVVKKDPNIHSGTQLSHFLYNVKKFKPVKTTVSGQGATDEEALMDLNLPELKDLIQIRKLKKVRDTYLEAFTREQVDGYVHPSFNLHLVKTFRSSSDRPNFQNIPKRDKESMQIIRDALYPRPGHQLMEIDYSGIEVRIAACYHKDPTMIQYINDPTTDMHSDMAKQIFMLDEFDKCVKEYSHLRSAVKNGFVFPQFYGDYYGNCAVNIACEWCQLPTGKWNKEDGFSMFGDHLGNYFIRRGIKSLEDFTQHIKHIEQDFWYNRFPIYRRWKEHWWKQYQKNGYVDLLTGFRCSGILSKNDTSNWPVQGAAFHCLLWSFIELDAIMRRNKWDTRLIGQIHDSIVLDVHPNELEMVAKIAQQVTCHDLPQAWKWINVPLEIEMEIADVDRPWSELKNYVIT